MNNFFTENNCGAVVIDRSAKRELIGPKVPLLLQTALSVNNLQCILKKKLVFLTRRNSVPRDIC